MLELRLTHDGEVWIAENGRMRVEAHTLAEVDRLVGAAAGGTTGANADQIEVRMYFDNAQIPQWMRQFSGHYFNRVVTIDLRRGED